MSVTLIAGSRSIVNESFLLRTIGAALRSLKPITHVIHGGARGVDQFAGKYAVHHNAPELPVSVYPADWDTYGKGAGFARNIEMVAVCEQAIIIWDGKSRGTLHTIERMLASGKPFVVVSLGAGALRDAMPDGET